MPPCQQISREDDPGRPSLSLLCCTSLSSPSSHLPFHSEFKILVLLFTSTSDTLLIKTGQERRRRLDTVPIQNAEHISSAAATDGVLMKDRDKGGEGSGGGSMEFN